MPSRESTSFCSPKCAHSNNIIHKDITKEYLEPLIWELGYTGLKPLLNMSDNGIKKMAKRLGCLLPPAYFHQKNPVKDRRVILYKEAISYKVPIAQ